MRRLNRLYIENLSSKTDKVKLTDIFEKYGKIERIDFNK